MPDRLRIAQSSTYMQRALPLWRIASWGITHRAPLSTQILKCGDTSVEERLE